LHADRGGRHLVAGRVLEPDECLPFAWGQAPGERTTEAGGVL